MGYKGDNESYGDEIDYNIDGDDNQMNFISTRNNYQPLRSAKQHHIIRGGRRFNQNFNQARRSGGQQNQASNYGLKIDVPKSTYDMYDQQFEPSYGVATSNDQGYNNIDDQIPDEYKNDPLLYEAIKASLRDLHGESQPEPQHPSTPKKNERKSQAANQISGVSVDPMTGQDPLTGMNEQTNQANVSDLEPATSDVERELE